MYIKLVPVGRKVTKGRAFGSLEAGKYVGPLRAPVSGAVIEVNEEVIHTPHLVNTTPYQAWFVVIHPARLEEDLSDLVQGAEAIQTWLEAQLTEFKEQGLFAEQ